MYVRNQHAPFCAEGQYVHVCRWQQVLPLPYCRLVSINSCSEYAFAKSVLKLDGNNVLPSKPEEKCSLV